VYFPTENCDQSLPRTPVKMRLDSAVSEIVASSKTVSYLSLFAAASRQSSANCFGLINNDRFDMTLLVPTYRSFAYDDVVAMCCTPLNLLC